MKINEIICKMEFKPDLTNLVPTNIYLKGKNDYLSICMSIMYWSKNNNQVRQNVKGA